MRLVLPLPDGPPISACGGLSPSVTSTRRPSGPSPTGAVSPPAELACHRSTGSRSVKAAGSGPAETRPAMARQVAVTRSAGGAGSSRTSNGPVRLDLAAGLAIADSTIGPAVGPDVPVGPDFPVGPDVAGPDVAVGSDVAVGPGGVV